MNIKSTMLLALALGLGTVTCMPVHATTTHLKTDAIDDTSLGTTQPIEAISNFWNEYNNDPNIVKILTSKAVHGFQYVKITESGYVEGITEIGSEEIDDLPDDWTVIFYLATSTMYDRTVFAFNNHDGTATIYNPGENPF